jgi:hypothetical protein
VADVERVGHLNRALRRAGSDQGRSSADLRVRKEDEARFQAKLAFFDGLDQAEVVVQEVEKQEGKCALLDRAIKGLRELRTQFLKARGVVDHFQGVDQIVLPEIGTLDEEAQQLEQLGALQQRLHEAQERARQFQGVDEISVPNTGAAQTLLTDLETLQEIRRRWVACQVPVTRYGQVLDALSGVSTSSAEDVLGELGGWSDLRNRWQQAVGEVATSETMLRTAEGEVEEARREFDDALAELGECPLCGHVTGTQ